MKKHLLRLLLCAGLLAGLFTVTALAAEWTYDPDAKTLTNSGTVVLKNVIADGTNLTIGNNQDFTGATLDLTGPITDSSGTERYTITDIAGWDELAKGAFYKCSSLTSVRLPDSLTSVGYDAFRECSGLTSIALPDSLETIGYFAFSDCSGLTSIALPDSLETIGQFAFSGCSGLTSLTLPDSVASIEEEAFGDCSGLTAFHVAEGNQNFSAQDGVLFNKDQTKLIQYPMGKGEVSYQVPTDVTEIGAKAFQNCGNLTMVTLPDGVTSIGEYAFYGCSSLTSIHLSDGVTSIGYGAFYGCSSLTGITMPDGVTSIGYGAFYGCSSLTGITLPDGVTSIGYSVFSGCSGLTSIDLPDGLETIGDSVFSGCSSLTGITLPDGVTSIGYGAFSGCSSLTGITLPDGVTSIGYSVFSGCSGLTSIDLPDGLETIGDSAFDGCIGLTGIILPDGVTSIGEYAFYGCSGLTSIDLPDGLETIGDWAFSGCIGLTGITLPDGVTSIGDWAFSGCSSLTGITLPDGVTSIGEGAFYDCSSLTELVLLAQTPPDLGMSALFGVGSTLRIVVPGGSVEAYKQAPDWVGYAASIEALSYGLTVATDSPSLELPQGATPAGAAFTITNNSNVTVSGLKVSLTDSGNFELDTSEMAASLAPNGATTFTVTPRSGLAAGSYSTDVNVTSMISSVHATASLTCTVKKVEIAADPASLNFGSAYTGYTQPGSQTVTVTNTGEQAVTLTQPLDTAYFTVGPLSDAALAAGEQAAFTVQPKTGLAPGEYSETLAISGQSGGRPVKLQVLLSFKVAEPVYGISSDTTVWNFGTVTEGYSEAPAGKEVTVTNTGNQTVTVTLPAGTNYAITAGAGFANDAATIAPNGTAAFTIRPKTGLAPGTYSETLTVSGTYSVSADVALRFVVERQSGGSSGGGGGGSGSAMYAVSLAAPEHGTVTVSPKSAVKGSTVTVTATPDEGYRLDTLTVTDSQGNQMKLTDQGGGKFTFIMPGSQVKVEASFVLIPQEPEPLPFADVAETAWYYDGVRYAYEHGLMTGTGETTFNPDGATSRAMLAAILWRLEGSPVVNYAMDFADVEEGQWYTEAIRWAASEGIVTGYGDGTFGTNDSITREQFAVMLYRYAGTQPASGTLSAFRDGAAVSDWAAEAMGWAVEAGLITGTGDGSALTPQGQATRAQAAVLLMRFCQEYMA
ncbi:leucine-rich repeat protein [Pseudoflavonifractor phocaeensis]|uniref:leucine-rich repeat protein n=1 Tax=Pseudoflavonifractor phocaeensis TaxID=1870988 RepID=UPI00195E0887|nr:leucine-rich repeat protein [Pseudoflavonifractor phocaeensis]MBM6721930.1 leucine-rich repeat protein [Pseudoflavonifractor phocaeensis]